MSIPAVGDTVYPDDVAKVLISIPDDLLRRIDEFAKRSAETRSGFLQRLAEREIAADNARRKKEFEELLGPPLHLGGDTVRKIKEGREDGKPWR
jgi:HicB_like antitoxin of bacterial toxin-antitoxin system